MSLNRWAQRKSVECYFSCLLDIKQYKPLPLDRSNQSQSDRSGHWQKTRNQRPRAILPSTPSLKEISWNLNSQSGPALDCRRISQTCNKHLDLGIYCARTYYIKASSQVSSKCFVWNTVTIIHHFVKCDISTGHWESVKNEGATRVTISSVGVAHTLGHVVDDDLVLPWQLTWYLDHHPVIYFSWSWVYLLHELERALSTLTHCCIYQIIAECQSKWVWRAVLCV